MSQKNEKGQVFASLSYEVFDMPGFFSQFHDFIGHFQIEQTMQESLNKQFRIWFWTDAVEIKDGDLRQVEIIATSEKKGFKINFQIRKIK